MKTLLKEGLRKNDLQNLIKDTISINQFESKIDPHAIVIGFYVKNIDAARDLNRFLQRVPEEILDVDVSPSYNISGEYMVFVEMLPSDKFVSSLQSILKDVENLCNVKEWKMVTFDDPTPKKLNFKSIEKFNAY